MRSKKFLAVLLSCATLISSAMPVNAATLSLVNIVELLLMHSLNLKKLEPT